MINHRILSVLITFIFMFIVTSCGGSSSDSPQVDPATGSTWGEMKWGEGKWEK
jgi:hypothetical protein